MSITLTLLRQIYEFGCIMSKVKKTNNSDFNDAIELMFFAYRDFIADPDVILEAHGFGRAHHRVLHFVAGNPGISIADLLDILRVTKNKVWRVCCATLLTAIILNNALAPMTAASGCFT